MGLGSNIGDRKKNITDATMICGSVIGTLEKLSSMYETAPRGYEGISEFINRKGLLHKCNGPLFIGYR